MQNQANFPIFPRRRYHRLFAWSDKVERSFWSLGATLAISSLYFTKTLLPEHSTFYWTTTCIGWLCFLIGLLTYLSRKKVKRTFDGNISIDSRGLKVDTNHTIHEWPWEEIHRMDIYLYCGLPARKYPSILSAFINENIFENLLSKTEILHIRVQINNQFHSYYVMNKYPGSKRRGLLYDHLKSIRALSIRLHRKIQFWDKRKFAT